MSDERTIDRKVEEIVSQVRSALSELDKLPDFDLAGVYLQHGIDELEAFLTARLP